MRRRSRSGLAGIALLVVVAACANETTPLPDAAVRADAGPSSRDGGTNRDGGDDADAGVVDSGALRDGGAIDAGARDSGLRDAGDHDAGFDRDAGDRDGGPPDAGTIDAGTRDGGVRDGGPSCNDGVRNADEIWVDCGGWCNNVCPPCPGTGNLLRNGDFEAVPSGATGQGLLPSEWVALSGSPDTYSNDGSYGLLPEAFGNFTGVVAYDGLRFVGAWNSAQEDFAQTLTSTLTAGVRYRVEAVLHPATRPDLSNPGGYDVGLAADTARNASHFIGRLADTSTPAWDARAFEFIAPANASALEVFFLEPDGAASTYPGLDALSLVQTTSCAP